MWQEVCQPSVEPSDGFAAKQEYLAQRCAYKGPIAESPELQATLFQKRNQALLCEELEVA
jgi:hypothetical protein